MGRIGTKSVGTHRNGARRSPGGRLERKRGRRDRGEQPKMRRPDARHQPLQLRRKTRWPDCGIRSKTCDARTSDLACRSPEGRRDGPVTASGRKAYGTWIRTSPIVALKENEMARLRRPGERRTAPGYRSLRFADQKEDQDGSAAASDRRAYGAWTPGLWEMDDHERTAAHGWPRPGDHLDSLAVEGSGHREGGGILEAANS